MQQPVAAKGPEPELDDKDDGVPRIAIADGRLVEHQRPGPVDAVKPPVEVGLGGGESPCGHQPAGGNGRAGKGFHQSGPVAVSMHHHVVSMAWV